MSADTLISTRATDVLPGDRLDLEGDRFATMTGHGGRDPATSEHEMTVSTFEFELAVVESVERETENCIVIETNLVVFGCPPDHKLKRQQELPEVVVDEIVDGKVLLHARFTGLGAEQKASEWIAGALDEDHDHEYGISVSDDRCPSCRETFSREAWVEDKNDWLCPHCDEIDTRTKIK